jgi:alpha-glucosidase
MATTARAPLLFYLVLCLCCCAPCLCAELVAGSGGYAVRTVTVDKGGARLRAELAAIAAAGGGGVHAAYGDDVRNLDVYARCDYNEHHYVHSTTSYSPPIFPLSSKLLHLHVFGCKITVTEY